MTALERLPSIM